MGDGCVNLQHKVCIDKHVVTWNKCPSSVESVKGCGVYYGLGKACGRRWHLSQVQRRDTIQIPDKRTNGGHGWTAGMLTDFHQSEDV